MFDQASTSQRGLPTSCIALHRIKTLHISTLIAASQGCAHSSLTIRAVLRKRTKFESNCHHYTTDATTSRMRHVHVLQVGQGHFRTIATQIDVVSAATCYDGAASWSTLDLGHRHV